MCVHKTCTDARQWFGRIADVRDGVPGVPRQTLRSEPESNRLNCKNLMCSSEVQLGRLGRLLLYGQGVVTHFI